MVEVLPDFDNDCDVDEDDWLAFESCITGPDEPYVQGVTPPGCQLPVNDKGFVPADFDSDLDIDLTDYGLIQRCYSGNTHADPTCDDPIP